MQAITLKHLWFKTIFHVRRIDLNIILEEVALDADHQSLQKWRAALFNSSSLNLGTLEPMSKTPYWQIL